jgi:hypothetical protein
MGIPYGPIIPPKRNCPGAIGLCSATWVLLGGESLAIVRQ